MVNSLKKIAVKNVPLNKISLVKNENLKRRNPNSNYFGVVVNYSKNRQVMMNNKNLTRNQMRAITSRLSRNNLINRIWYLQKRNRIHNANSLEKFINTFRMAYPVNNPEAAPLAFIVRRLVPTYHNMSTYKPYRNLMAKKNNLSRNEFRAAYRQVGRKYNINRQRMLQILNNL